MLANNANNNDKLRKRTRTNLAIINTITTVRELTLSVKIEMVNSPTRLPHLSKLRDFT